VSAIAVHREHRCDLRQNARSRLLPFAFQHFNTESPALCAHSAVLVLELQACLFERRALARFNSKENITMLRSPRLPRLIQSILASLLFALCCETGIAANTIKIGTVVWIGYGPFYVADALDLYKKYGVKVTLQYFTDPALIPPAIAGDSVDGGMLTYDQVIGQVAKSIPMKVVMPIDYSNGGDAIVASKDISKVSDFKGKKVAYNPLSPSDFLLAYALQVNKMSEKDIQPVNMTPEAIPAAMASGSLPVGVTYEPNVSQIIGLESGSKFHVVYSSKDAPGLITDVLVFKPEYIKAHPKEVAAIIHGYLDAMEYMKKNPDEAATLIGKAMGVSADEVKDQMKGVYNIPLSDMPKNFAKSKATTSLHASGAVIGKILIANGQIKKTPPIEETYDESLLKGLARK
jgi:NitT/TauT family transport system substrate-binding protein